MAIYLTGDTPETSILSNFNILFFTSNINRGIPYTYFILYYYKKLSKSALCFIYLHLKQLNDTITTITNACSNSLVPHHRSSDSIVGEKDPACNTENGSILF